MLEQMSQAIKSLQGFHGESGGNREVLYEKNCHKGFSVDESGDCFSNQKNVPLQKMLKGKPVN